MYRKNWFLKINFYLISVGVFLLVPLLDFLAFFVFLQLIDNVAKVGDEGQKVVFFGVKVGENMRNFGVILG